MLCKLVNLDLRLEASEYLAPGYKNNNDFFMIGIKEFLLKPKNYDIEDENSIFIVESLS